MSRTAFERYAPFIQNSIYRKNWLDLREVQVETCEAILDSDSHVMIASGTASGKTEAAFFPILTLLDHKPSDSIGVLYIGPLKALINDQLERLNELLEGSGIPVWAWHGDISQSVKKRVLREARGILQITPESLEALLIRHPGEIPHLFSDLRFVVIDEIHALIGIDRGLQVLCLLARLEKMANCDPRRIGLSATLSDYESAKQFLASGSKRDVRVVGIRQHARMVSLCVESFPFPIEPAEAERVARNYHEFLYQISHQKKCLIFTNSRGNAEQVIVNLKNIAQERQEPDVFYVHHGSVSATLRREAEMALREREGATVTAATLTLELGIDIGDLDFTIQIGAPFSCASFVQRLGRSGRHTGKSQMLFVNCFEETNKNLFERLPWELLRAIAVIQLYLEERWVEPFEKKKKPFSILAHQTLSTLMVYGELSASELARQVLLLPAFRDRVTPEEYRELLQDMLEQEYLQKMEHGGMIIGLKGERLVHHYSFYAVFQEEQTFTVYRQEEEIGTLENCPTVEEVFVLAGLAWQVLEVDRERRRIYVTPVKNSRIPVWNGGGGHIHTRVVQRMRQVLLEETQYPYLLEQAAEVLRRARKIARESGILERSVIPCSANSFYLCPWVGSRIMQTLKCLLSCGMREELQIKSIYEGVHYLQVFSRLPVCDVAERLRGLEVDLDSAELVEMVLPPEQMPRIDKYDWMVPKKLLRRAFLYNELDVAGAVNVLRGELS